jgi:hypothetical protein
LVHRLTQPPYGSYAAYIYKYRCSHFLLLEGKPFLTNCFYLHAHSP